MRYMNRAGTNQKGLSPGRAEGRNVSCIGDDGGFKTFKRAEVHSRDEEYFFGFGLRLGGGFDSAPEFGDISDYANKNFGDGLVRNYIRGAAALDGANVQCAGAEDWV